MRTDFYWSCAFRDSYVAYSYISVAFSLSSRSIQCIVDGPDLRLSWFSIIRRTRCTRRRITDAKNASRLSFRGGYRVTLETRRSREEGQQSLDCSDGRWSALSIFRSREIDAKHCRLRKVDGGLGQHEVAESATRLKREQPDRRLSMWVSFANIIIRINKIRWLVNISWAISNSSLSLLL